MFQFGFLSANIMYMVFIAVYIVTFGLFSLSKLEAGKLLRGEKEQAREKILSYEDPADQNSDSSFHYDNYFCDCNEAVIPTKYLSFTTIQGLNDKIQYKAIIFTLLSRPPPIS